MPARNVVNIEAVRLSFGDDPVLDGVSLGVAEGERIAVVGRNGAGKSSLLSLLARRLEPDSGRVTLASSVHVETVLQSQEFPEALTVATYVLGERAEHEWAGDARIREILGALLGTHDAAALQRTLAESSGGERRRAQLARALIADVDLLLLDEPTNHLDVEAVAWLAQHLLSRPSLAVVVVTHDRWFLDAVCERTWEVVEGRVEEYDGGYSAYVLAKAERQRQAAAIEARRRNLLRKELAWLRRGAPARTSKPKFRIDAANLLIEGEPPVRDDVELLAFAGARMGRVCVELHAATVSLGGRALLQDVDLDIAPGARLGILGPNGAGKTTLVRTLLGLQPLDSGRRVIGRTVKSAYLSQHLDELDPTRRVLQAVEDIASRVLLSTGRELTASQMCERLGFGADAQWTPVADLSGGERRRLQLARLLMGGPNLLVLDEPTNDFDVETLTALEDLLDSYGGTLLVISHDQYFLERVCNDVIAVMGDGSVRHLPGGIPAYIEARARALASVTPSATPVPARDEGAPVLSAARMREIRKEVARIERSIAKAEQQQADLHERMAAASTDYAELARLTAELDAVVATLAQLEGTWLELAEQVTS